MSKIIRVVVFLLLSTAVFVGVKYALKSQTSSSKPDTQTTPATDSKPKSSEKPVETSTDSAEVHDYSAEAHDYVVKNLKEKGLCTELAEKIFQRNELIFTSWFEYDKGKLDTQMGAFTSLGLLLDVQQQLLEYPELATLAAAIASRNDKSADEVKALMESIPKTSEEDVNVVLSLYGLYAEPDSAINLAKMLTRGENKKYIVTLAKQNMYDITFLKIFELLEKTCLESPEVGKVYQEWLYKLLDQMIAMDPNSDGYDNNYLIILSQSEPLIAALKSSPEFRDHFFSNYWAKYENLLNSIPRDEDYEPKLLNYISSANIWTFWIAYPNDGLELLKKYGELAPKLLMNPAFRGTDPQKQKASQNLIYFMRHADEESSKSLYFINESIYPEFAEFMSRDIEASYIQKGINALAYAEDIHTGTSAKEKLDYWKTLKKDKVLLKDDDFREDKFSLIQLLPGYDIGVLISKWIDGRKVNNTDLIMAGVDSAFIVADVIAIVVAVPSGGGSMVAVEASKKAAGKAVTQAGVGALGKVAARPVTRYLTKETLKQAERRTVLSFLKASRELARKEWIKFTEMFSKMGRVDITSKIQGIFRSSSMGCGPFKKLTGLDARIFMRGDRRIFFDFKPILFKTGKVVAEDVAIGAAAYYALTSEPGQKAIDAISQRIQAIAKKGSESDMWKSDLSAWWMVNQYGDVGLEKSNSKTKTTPTEKAKPTDSVKTTTPAASK